MQFESSQSRSVVEATKNEAHFSPEHLAFLDYDAIYYEIQRYKTEKARHNVNVTKKGIYDLLNDNSWYKLLISEDELVIHTFEDYKRFERIAIALLTKYLDKLYYTERSRWESKVVGYDLVAMDDENENFFNEENDEYIITINNTDDNETMIQWINQIIVKVSEAKKNNQMINISEIQGDMEAIGIPVHLYNPLLYLSKGNMEINVSPVALNESELKFVKALKKYVSENDTYFKDKKLYLIRNRSRIIQECMRLILEPICEARFYPHSYGFRPYRAQKHAIRDIVNVINASVKSKDQPVWAVEGDIKGCFDNINHRLLLKKLWRIGIHDKRVLKIISQMLKAGYIDQDLYHATEMGTPQGGILSPLLSNVYLNDFDWYVGRCYMEPHRQCKHKCNDTRRLKWSGITPKYNFRYADDWVILTSTEQEAFRMKHELTKYFKHRMKLELSQEKTYVTDLRKNGIHFLGYIVKAERKRKTPDPATWSDNLVGKPFPDMERLTKKIHTLQKEVRKIGLYTQSNTQAAQIQYVNSVIMGLAQYLQPSICSHAYHAIDRRVNNTALAVWKNLFPKQYNQMQVPLKELSNLPHRHEGYDSKTFAIQIDGKWFGITYAFITHSRYESKPFDQKMTPYTEDGRRRYVNYRTKHKPLPCDRPSINTPEDIALSIYASGKGWKANFEYFMNREYAYNRDKGKCKCCGRYFSELIPKHCHHVNPRLPIERINKVPNLAWLCIPCHRMVHNSPIPPELDAKAVRKIKKYREKLKK